MDAIPAQSELISNMQDEVVSLRQDVPKLYKGFLMKECQVVANQLADAKLNIPRQSLDDLRQNLQAADLEGTHLRNNPTQARQLLGYARMLRQYMGSDTN